MGIFECLTSAVKYYLNKSILLNFYYKLFALS